MDIDLQELAQLLAEARIELNNGHTEEAGEILDAAAALIPEEFWPE